MKRINYAPFMIAAAAFIGFAEKGQAQQGNWGDYGQYANQMTGQSQGAAPSAQAGVSLGVSGGYFFLSDIDSDDTSITFDTGKGFNIPLGFHFGNGFTFELSGGYYSADVDTIYGKRGGLNTDSELSLVPIMASGIVHLPASETVSVYLGGGGGLVYSAIDVKEVDDVDISLEEDAYDLGIQAKAGVQFHFGNHVTLDVGYRFQNVFTEDESMQGHSLEAGFTIKF